jgi:hypothetical protein
MQIAFSSLIIGIQQTGSLIVNNILQLREIILNNTLNNDFLIVF